MRLTRYLSMFAGATLLAGCIGQDVELLNNTEAVGSPFTQQLAAEYRDLANFEAFEMEDWRDAEFFARKGLAAAAGENVEPSVLADWAIPEEFLPELTDARARLVGALGAGARDTHAIEAAIAQAKFDCWVEQQEENIQPDHIAACRDEFYAAMAIIEGVRPIGDATYFVFFDFDQSVITATAQPVIQEVIADWSASGTPGIAVVGHTDRSGNPGYNLGLSQRRAAAVSAALQAGGVPGASITTDALGESAPLVPTPDGVREPSNRRAEITLLN